MKKYILFMGLGILIIFLIIGGILFYINKPEKIYCNYSYNKDGNFYNSEIFIKVKDGKVINATSKMTYTDNKTAEYMCEVFKKTDDAGDNLKCYDNIIEIENYHKSIELDNYSKEQFIKYLETQKFTCE